jgi:type II secretory pathway pseudopilin PulG
MLIVMALIGLVVSISFPSVSAGLDSLRLSTAATSTAAFLNSALNRASRVQQAMEVTIDPRENSIQVVSARPGYERKLELPPGVRIAGVLPPPVQDSDEPRRFVLYPGGTMPRFGVELINGKGARRTVRIDPITGVPQVERPEAP